jgi:hypothetical protein
MQSVFLFHVYHTTRRILCELKVALPQDSTYNPFSNTYDRRAYERLCAEFGVSPRADWRQKSFPNSNGLGDVYTKGHTAWRQTDFRHGSPDKHIAIQNAGNLDPAKMTFGPEVAGARHCGVSSCDWLPPKKAHIEHVLQDPGVDGDWSTFVLDKSNGFTQAGVSRLNGTIRSYVWALLGAQSQTRSRIVGVGTAFDAQKQFLANVEDAINSPVDIPSAIMRYQDVLQYAKSQVGFVFGHGLYMAPSDMLLRIGHQAGYNNEIVIAISNLSLGRNDDVNGVADMPTTHGSFPAASSSMSGPKPEPPTVGTTDEVSEQPRLEEQHEDEKKALIVGGVITGLVILWLRA